MLNISMQLLDVSAFENLNYNMLSVGLGVLGVSCSPRDANAEVDGYFSGRKNPEHKSCDKDFKLGIPSLGFQAR